MRRHYLLALASSASLALLAAAGCSSSEDGGGAGPLPDAGTPDTSTPNHPDDDASTPDGGTPKPDAGPHEPGWDPSFSLPGVAGRLAPQINAMARIGNRQIALAGNFEQAGSIPTKFVALWNGNAWLSIGSGLPDAIDKMVATPSGELFGTVRTSDGFVTKLFKWNKTAWSEVATFDSLVTSLEMAPDGTLYASGWFTSIGASSIANLAKFTGNTWSAVPDAPERINVVRVLDGVVCIGGSIDPEGAGVQCLENGSWVRKALSGTYGEINDLGIQNGDLIAAGRFGLSPDEEGGSLARWTGSAWELIGGGIVGPGYGDVQDMEIDGDKIYVTGDLRFAGGMQVNHVAMWDVTQKRWSSLNDGVYGSSGGFGFGPPPGQALVKDQGGEIYVGGQFSMIGGRNALGIARWDGNQWNPVDDPKAKRLGVNGGVQAMAEAPNGVLYIGGGFPLVGGDVAANNVARFENDAWTSLGLGFDGAVNAIAVKGSTVFAGGDFLRSGAILTKYVAQWNGSSWSGLGAGLDGRVKTLAVGPDGNLYAGGEFERAGDAVVNHIAKWNGTTWQAIGDGFDSAVNAIGFDSDGKLYAGGEFTTSGNTDVNHIAAWDGTAWSTVGAGVNGEYGGSVSSIVVYDGKLTIGGSFDRSGTAKDAPKVYSPAAWDGAAWVSIGGGTHRQNSSGDVLSMSVRGTELYVAGMFERAGSDAGGGVTVNNVAMWDGTTWSDLGGGASDSTNVILVSNDAFWIGGSFTFAGNQGGYNIARFWFSN